MQLGVFQKDPKTGGFIGAVRTLVSSVEPVRLIPREKGPDAHKDAPDYDVLGGPGRSDFGAGWIQKRQLDGIEYVSLRLYDPSFNNGQALRPALWPRKDGVFVMIHEPMEPAVAADAEAAPARPAEMNGTGKRRGARKDAPSPEGQS